MTVVGVAADVMDAGLGVQQGPTLYVDYFQLNTATARVSLVVRTAGDALVIAGGVRRAIWSVDPNQPIDRVERLADVLRESTGDQRFRTVLLSSFALIGLALALVGVYGVTSAAVKARTWEAGVRMALGATPGSVVRGLLREASVRVLVGVAAGIVVFIALGRLAAGLLYHTSIADPLILACAVLPLAALALAVSYWQARHLALVPPVNALRDDQTV
jgi:putative ABC transport system permease protein